MMNGEQLDQLITEALSSKVEPSEELNRKIINQFKEHKNMKTMNKNKISRALIAFCLFFAVSIVAFATLNLNSPSQVADYFGYPLISKAFDSEDALLINQSMVSKEYVFTLHGIVSGEGLANMGGTGQNIHSDKSYAVVSIKKQDGSKMPDTRDKDYNKPPFFISPLIKGQKPWLVNVASMNGGYHEDVIDGILFRLVECERVEMFADRGLYLCISSSAFYDIHAFNFNEETGEISLNTDYKGANALFDLPLDVKKADYDKAEEYLQELLKEPEAE